MLNPQAIFGNKKYSHTFMSLAYVNADTNTKAAYDAQRLKCLSIFIGFFQAHTHNAASPVLTINI